MWEVCYWNWDANGFSTIISPFEQMDTAMRACVCVWSPAPPSQNMRSPERIAVNGFHEYVTTSDSVFVTEGHYGSKCSTMRLLYWGSQRRRQALYKTLRVIEMDPPYLVLTIHFMNCGYVLCAWKQQSNIWLRTALLLFGFWIKIASTKGKDLNKTILNMACYLPQAFWAMNTKSYA